MDRQSLVVQNRRLVFYLANKFRRRFRVTYDDLVGAGMEALCYAAKIYDPARGPFVAIAGTCVRQRMARYCSWELTGKQNGFRQKTRRPEFVFSEDSHTEHPAPTVDPDRALDLGNVQRFLDARICGELGSRVLRMRHYEGLSYYEIGKRLGGKSHESARQYEQAALRRIRRWIVKRERGAAEPAPSPRGRTT